MNDSYFTSGGRQIRARFLQPGAVRITHSAPGAALPADRPWLGDVLLPGAAVEAPGLQVALADGQVEVRSHDGRFVFREADGPRFGAAAGSLGARWVIDIPAVEIRREDDRAADGVSLTLATEPGEGFYGWGEWFDAFRRQSGKVRLKTRDAIALIQERETYSALPVFYSSRGYLFWLLNSHATGWTLEAGAGRLTVDAAGPGADYILIYGPDFRDLVTAYTALTGRPPLPPRWAFGLMVTGYPQEAQAVVLDRVAEHRRRQLPLDAVILDYHWEQRFHDFEWRRSLFPAPADMLATLAGQGVRLGLITTPFQTERIRPIQRGFLQAAAGNIPPGELAADERALAEYRHGKERGYFAHERARWWFGQGGMVDFTNPQAADWWNGLMRPRYAEGVAFFKNDDGEYLPPDARSHLGLSGREYHNLYGFFYSRALFEGMQALDDRRGFVYARSAWVGSQRFPALFLGDQKPTFAHIRSTLRAGLNLGLLGFAHWTADVFGLDGPTTPELHMRYAQWALLAPIARYFWRPPAVDPTRFPWSHGPAAEASFRVHTDLRYRLLPYYYGLAWQAWLTGLPPLRPLLLEFPDDPRFAGLDDQALLGPGLLLAPVLAAGAAGRRIELPTGTWHDFWTGQSWAGGGAIEYPGRPDRLPLLVRGGTILPLGPARQFIPDDHRFDDLELVCWPPYPARLRLYDDDGLSRAYQRGAFATSEVSVQPAGSGAAASLSAATGDFAGKPARRRMAWTFQRTARPAWVRVNGAAWADWSHEAGTECLRVRTEGPADQAITVEFGGP